MVETLCFGLALLFIGNNRVSQSLDLKRYKLMLSIVMILVGGVTALQWSMQLNTTNPLVNEALNITLVTIASFLICLAVLPLASPNYLTTPRLLTSIATFVGFIIFMCIALTQSPTLIKIILFISAILYFIELARVNIVFFYSFRTLRDSHPEPGSAEEQRSICLNLIVHCFIALSVSALLFVIFVILTQQFKTIYTLAMLLVWAFLFVKTVNIILEHNPLEINKIIDIIPTNSQQEESAMHNELSAKVNEWVENERYRTSGITMTQAAQELSTNRVYLSQYINSRFGCNFKTWVAKLRIDYAKQLLATTTITIDMVASRSGFSNKAQFIKTFKALEGCTPGAWRQKN